MKNLNYHIEQADNGIVIGDRTDCKEHEPSTSLEVALDKDVQYTIGRTIWLEIKHLMDKELCNAVELEINIKPKQYRI